MNRCAAEGAATRYVRTVEHFEECRECKIAVRFDLTNHYFFGFQNTCPKNQKRTPESATTDPAVDPSGGVSADGPRAHPFPVLFLIDTVTQGGSPRHE